MARIQSIRALEILDSRGNPTLEATVITEEGVEGKASVPSGASTGSHEAVELRDNDKKRYSGKGVLTAVANVKELIAPKLIGKNVSDQEEIDETMISLDGTANKAKLGANSILAVSLACARAAAAVNQKPLYQYLRDKFFQDLGDDWLMPVPMLNVLNGGKHALGSVDLQEFMILPRHAGSFAECLRWGVETYQALKKLLFDQGLPVGVGDEGGFMPKLSSHKEVLELLVEAIAKAGYQPGKQIALALDPAANEIFSKGKYVLKTEGKTFSSAELISLYEDWLKTYPIVSIEDGLSEDDWDGFKLMTKKLGKKIQIVGDDLYVTNLERLKRGVKEKASNAILVKLNQIGSLSETAEVINYARNNGMAAVVSHRSGETEDDFIADLVVAAGTGQIKTGAPARSERVAKYNRLLKIEKELGGKVR